MRALAGVLAGAAAGVLSGMGVGGGSLLLLWLTTLGGMDQPQAAGVNLLYFACCALPALWGHRKRGHIRAGAVLWCALAGAPACCAGALLAGQLELSLLRRAMGGLFLLMGIREVLAREEPAHKEGPSRPH